MRKHSEKEISHTVPNKILIEKPIAILLSFILFCILFVAIFYLGKASSINNYNDANNNVPSIRNFGASPKILDIFSKFGALFGIGLGAIMLIMLFILYGVAAITKLTKHKLTIPITILIVYGFWFLIGLKLAFFENGYTAWANGIIYFTAKQLFYSTLIIILGVVALLFLSKNKKGGKE